MYYATTPKISSSLHPNHTLVYISSTINFISIPNLPSTLYYPHLTNDQHHSEPVCHDLRNHPTTLLQMENHSIYRSDPEYFIHCRDGVLEKPAHFIYLYNHFDDIGTFY